MPSCVAFTQDSYLVGVEAKAQVSYSSLRLTAHQRALRHWCGWSGLLSATGTWQSNMQSCSEMLNYLNAFYVASSDCKMMSAISADALEPHQHNL